MAQTLGDRLPDALQLLLAGSDIQAGASPTMAVLVLTVDQDGWPRQAMVSLGELVARGPSELRLALWPSGNTAGNLARTGRATLTLVYQRIGYSLRCSANRPVDLDLPLSGRLACFALRVTEVLADDAVYAELTSGISYRLLSPEVVLPRWRETIAALLGKCGPADYDDVVKSSGGS